MSPLKSFNFILSVAPRYEPTESTYRVIEGSSPQLLLNVELPTAGIQPVWTKDGVSINTTSRLSLRIDGLVFSSVTKEDTGVYVVQATDRAGTGRATINVEVYCKIYCTYVSLMYFVLIVNL